MDAFIFAWATEELPPEPPKPKPVFRPKRKRRGRKK